MSPVAVRTERISGMTLLGTGSDFVDALFAFFAAKHAQRSFWILRKPVAPAGQHRALHVVAVVQVEEMPDLPNGTLRKRRRQLHALRHACACGNALHLPEIRKA